MSTESNNQTLIDRLFSAGAHFGFSKSRRHPTVKPYIFTNKQGTDIFDLEKTVEVINETKKMLQSFGAEGKNILFVGTKDEISSIVKEVAERIEMPYVTNRWIGGMLTNFNEIKKRINRLISLTEEGESGELERKYTKKERVLIGRELDKLNFNFGGIKKLERPPQMIFIVDPRNNFIAVQEARDLNIPITAIMSSDSDISRITYPVIVNDALQSSVSLVLNELVDAYVLGKSEYVPKPARSNDRRGRNDRSPKPFRK